MELDESAAGQQSLINPENKIFAADSMNEIIWLF